MRSTGVRLHCEKRWIGNVSQDRHGKKMYLRRNWTETGQIIDAA